MIRVRSIIVGAFAALTLISVGAVSACGGLFCQNVPVDQQAERIIFTMNADDTISAYVQINYTGSAPDFSWVVPVPNVPLVDVAEISMFDELSTLTSPVFIPPPMPSCASVPVPMAVGGAIESAAMQEGVVVLASGTAGPYAYDVITSPDPAVMIAWLRENNYRVEDDMEPLIAVYNAEGMVFLAMKLQPEQGVQDIQPVVMTYMSDRPMIPLRLTAVAAIPNMSVITWIFGDMQAAPINWATPTINDGDIRGTFFSPDGTNYLSLVDQTVDLYNGRAFVTEFAQPTSVLRERGILDPAVAELAERHEYVTRVFARVSPEEMTVDPVFRFTNDIPDVDNIHDLSMTNDKIFWGCDPKPIEIEYDPNVVPEDFA